MYHLASYKSFVRIVKSSTSFQTWCCTKTFVTRFQHDTMHSFILFTIQCTHSYFSLNNTVWQGLRSVQWVLSKYSGLLSFDKKTMSVISRLQHGQRECSTAKYGTSGAILGISHGKAYDVIIFNFQIPKFQGQAGFICPLLPCPADAHAQKCSFISPVRKIACPLHWVPYLLGYNHDAFL